MGIIIDNFKMFEKYRNKETLKLEILDYLKANTDKKERLCVPTQDIAYKIGIRTEYCYKLLRELQKEKKVEYLHPIDKNNFNNADWIAENNNYISDRCVKIYDKIIEQIENQPNTINTRKGVSFLNDIILNSKLFYFYKEFKLINGVKIKTINIPYFDEKYNTILKNIVKIKENMDDLLFSTILNRLIELIIYIKYFPFITNEYNKRWNLEKEIEYLFIERKDDLKYIYDVLNDNEKGAIRHALFFSDSYDEVRYIDRFKDKLDYIERFKKLENSYLKYYEKNILKEEKFEEKLYLFSSWWERNIGIDGYSYKNVFDDYNVQVNDTNDSYILDNFQSLFNVKKEAKDFSFEFTGNLIEDYKRYSNAYTSSIK